MRTSEQVNELFAALSKAQGQMKNPEKNKTVKIQTRDKGTYSYNYADLPSTFDCVRKTLSDNGLAHSGSPTIKDGKYILVCRLGHTSGQWIEAEWPLFFDQDPKTLASAITYGTRYLFNCLVGISGDEDTDSTPENDSVYSNRGGAKAHAPSGHSPISPQTGPVAPKTASKAPHITEAQVKLFQTRASAMGLSVADVKQMLLSRFGVDSSKNLTMDVFNDALAALNALGDVP